MPRTKIEWAEETWNPLAGCSIVSLGCHNCYAMRMAHRLAAMGQEKYQGTTEKKNGRILWTGKINLDESALSIPLKKKKPTTWFVNSMSDLFHPDVPDWFVFRVWLTMEEAWWHTFQILTKRPDRMAAWVARWCDLSGELDEAQLVRGPKETRAKHPSGRGQLFAEYLESMGDPSPGCAFPTFDWMEGPRWSTDVLPNVWLGTSVENQQWADERIPHLLNCPAAVRFVSCEPLLGPIDLGDCFGTHYQSEDDGDPVTGDVAYNHGIDWVIVGGESGPGARPMHPDWPRSIRDQCVDAGVAFFFKQNGEYIWRPTFGDSTRRPKHFFDDGVWVEHVGKKKAGRLLDGREWNEMPRSAKEVALGYR